MTTDIQLILYIGSQCHLCTRARELLYSLLPPSVRLSEQCVDDDPELQRRYGVRIPVLAIVAKNGDVLAEKGWPFSVGQARRILEHFIDLRAEVSPQD